MKKFTFLLSSLILCSVFGQDKLPIPQQIDWSHAGLLPSTPKIADAMIDLSKISGATFDDQLASAIKQAKDQKGLTIIYIPAGKHYMRRPVKLTAKESNIVFQGAGSQSTQIFMKVGPSEAGFALEGNRIGEPIALQNDIKISDTVIKGKLDKAFQAGSWIRIYEDKFDDDYQQEGDQSNGYVGQITQIQSISADQFVIKDKAGKDFLAKNSLLVQLFNPIQNVGIENIYFEREDEKSPEGGNGNNFRTYVAVNCWFKGLESNLTSRSHFNIQQSAHIYISGCYVQRARLYDVGAYGYGVALGASTSNCLIENNIFKRVRHAIILGTGACLNVATFNYSIDQHATLHGVAYWDSDLNLHGRYPFSNLFEHNNVHFIEADDTHGNNGPYNTYVRNYVRGFELGYSAKISLDRIEKTNLYANDFEQKVGKVVEAKSPGAIATNIYGMIDGKNVTHEARYNMIIKKDAKNSLASFFYRSRPDFLSQSYTWPAIGPADKKSSNKIPAQDRYNETIKTYNPNPTKWPVGAIENTRK